MSSTYDITSPKGAFIGYGLDITDYKPRGLSKDAQWKLAQYILNEVKSTQSVIVRPYPGRLKLTRRQYNLLSGNPPDQPKGEDDWLYFNTPINIMELEIDETRTSDNH